MEQMKRQAMDWKRYWGIYIHKGLVTRIYVFKTPKKEKKYKIPNRKMVRRYTQLFHKKGNAKMANKHEHLLGLPSHRVSLY